jgi:hypothetical protein
MVRSNYACFTGSVGLYFPIVEDDNVSINVTYNTNFPLFISGIGKINKSYSHTSNVYYLSKQLYVFTKDYVETDIITLTYKYDSFFFISTEDILLTVTNFIDRCYDFFKLNRDVKFLINYNGMITNKDNVVQSDIKIYLLHELYHHFNTSDDYQSNWFSEGFTEFFCRYLSLTKKEFTNQNPYKNYNIKVMTKYNFWNNKFIEKLPYYKGFVYALYLYQYDKDFLNKYRQIINLIMSSIILLLR